MTRERGGTGAAATSTGSLASRRQPLSLLSLADGWVLPCFDVDISVAGAAVSADILPKIGTVLAVGKVVGRVVRLIADGFAMEFIVAQGRQEVEALVTSS